MDLRQLREVVGVTSEFDHKAACFTFDALEKVIIQAVAEDELEVAAEYVDTLFILADQLGEFHEEYRSESERLADRDAEWFQGGEQA